MAMIAVGTSPSNLVELPLDPSSFTWGLQDISSEDAGRTQDAGNTMYKNRTSQKRSVKLSWQNLTFDIAHQIVAAFNPEYIYVRYPDLLSGGQDVRHFYVGDRSAPFLWYQLPGAQGTRMSTLSFDIIEV
jgi:hypothetical protein